MLHVQARQQDLVDLVRAALPLRAKRRTKSNAARNSRPIVAERTARLVVAGRAIGNPRGALLK